MLKNLFLKTVFLFLALSTPLAHAKGYFEFIPLTPTSAEIPADSQVTIKYRLVNHSKTAHKLQMVPVTGITQLIEGKNSCEQPISLPAGKSCILNLKIIGSELPKAIHTGPLLCQFDSDDSANPSFCVQPLAKDRMLALKPVSENQALLSIPQHSDYCYGKKNLTACVIQMTATSGVPGTLTLFNNSFRTTASNIHAILPASWTDVSQNVTGCAVLPPRSSCTLYFYPGNMVHPPTSVQIVGTNATTTTVTMAVIAPTSLNISVSGSPLQIAPGDTQSLTITNNSGFPAFDIHSDFTGTALAGNISETANNCSAVAPGGSCTISFTAGTTAIPSTDFPIFGTNTIIATANITIQSAYVYVPNGASLSSGITQCAINAATGQLTGCNNYQASTRQPIGIAFNPARTIAYITNQSPDVVTQSLAKCDVTPGSGVFVNCIDGGATGLSFPQQVTLNPAGTFAYIANFTGTVTVCTINSPSGTLSGCVNSGGAIPAAGGIAINSAGTLAYITSLSTNTVRICNINSVTGLLSGCFISGATGLNGVRGIAFNSTGTIAYITNQNISKIIQCNVDSFTGNLMGCVDSGTSTVLNPMGIALDTINNRAYISNLVIGGAVTVCNINSLTGNLESCMNSGATLLQGPAYLVAG
ncbi:transmembrane protein [Legionella birminghamensis]|uniref:Transmembrane protein n=1 Tax=Legionella birminghamensis TaxID=28083 RepID=A0A378I9D3_9GAMM|nr:YncE family protein [Legionella birminghamensis]KTC68936.1 transmembrane protein [Legionella birminghamensis]STX31452.1 transmembrane protein [Legionella birminghamensis]